MAITANDPLNAPRRKIGFFSGDPKANSVRVVVASFVDATITVNAYSDVARTTLAATATVYNSANASTPKLSKYCDDRKATVYVGPGEEDYTYTSTPDDAGQTWLCYVGTALLTGLSPGTRYYISLSQTQSSVVITEKDASTCTAPAVGSDFRVYFAGCDISQNKSDDWWTDGGGAWRFIKHECLQSYTKPRFLIWADDIGYVDYLRNADQPVYDAETGKRMSAKTTVENHAYNFGMPYLALLGMLGQPGLSDPDTSTQGQTNGTSTLMWGADRNRMWCQRNMPMALQWGDHEFINDLGHNPWSSKGPDTFPNGENSNVPAIGTSYYINGKTAFNQLWGLVRPTPDIRVADAAANHWALTLGDLLIAAPEQITNGPGVPSSTPSPYILGSLLGDGQILDVLDVMTDPASPVFKCLVLATSDLVAWDVTNSSNAIPGTQMPMETCSVDDYHRLLFAPSAETGAEPPSLMQSAYTNGTSGVMLVMHGDYHTPFVSKYDGWETRFPSVVAAGLPGRWTEFNFGPTGGQVNNFARQQSTIDNMLVAGAYRGLTMLSAPDYVPLFDATPPQLAKYRYSTAYIDVRGSASPKNMQAGLVVGSPGFDNAIVDNDSNDASVVFRATFRVGSNLPYSVP